MKLTIILSSIVLGIVLGVYGGFRKPKALWWKIAVAAILLAGSCLSLYPRVAASVEELDYFAKYIGDKPIPTKIYISDFKYQMDSETGKSFIFIHGNEDFSDEPHQFYMDKANHDRIVEHQSWIVNASMDSTSHKMQIHELVQGSPWITYPYILALGDRIKILNFHVPMAWIAVLSYLISMIYSVRYLRSGDFRFDTSAMTAASLGTVFAILATVSGMIWAKFNWGSFWNWDPRETSIFILLLIYFAYFALRSGIEREEFRARASAVYSIIAFVTVPFLVFVMPRITSGLHPGSQGEGMGGPILNAQKGMLDSQLMFAFGLCMFGFVLLYFWLLNFNIRLNLLKKNTGE